MSCRFFSKPKIEKPTLIAAWPGMGSVAFYTVSYLINKIGAKEFAEIPSEDYYSPTSITARGGIIEKFYFPKNRFYYYTSSLGNLVLFLGEAQPSQNQYDFAKEVINVAKKLDVRFIYTLAGMLTYEDKQENLRVWCVATGHQLLDNLRQYNVNPMREAHISGLNGLLLGVAKETGIPGVCLLGELPFYAIQIEYTPTCLEILKVLREILGINFSIEEIEKLALNTKRQIQKIIEQLKQIKEQGLKEQLQSSEEGDLKERIEKELGISPEIPEYVKKKIEGLFEKAEKDISKAYELKAFLDKWELFSSYEDRFLDLFKRKNQ